MAPAALLVHAPAQEDAFVAAGDGINRLDVMYNDFVIVGPNLCRFRGHRGRANSLALPSDATHNLTDVIDLALSW